MSKFIYYVEMSSFFFYLSAKFFELGIQENVYIVVSFMNDIYKSLFQGKD